MYEREAQVVVTDEVGLHVRTAAAFAGEAQSMIASEGYYKGGKRGRQKHASV